MKVSDFGTLTDAERLLLDHVKKDSSGYVFIPSYYPHILNDQRISIRAEFLKAIIKRNLEELDKIIFDNIRIHGACIVGTLDISGHETDIYFQFRRCTFFEKLILNVSIVKSICFIEVTFRDGIVANGLRVNGDLIVAGCQLIKCAYFIGCYVEGAFNFDLNTLQDNSRSLCSDRLEAKGTIVLKNIESAGVISFTGAKSGGDFHAENCKIGGSVIDGYLHSLIVDRLNINGNVFLDKIVAEGEVRLIGSKIVGDLSFKSSVLKEDLICESVKVDGTWLWREGASCHGIINLAGSAINIISDEEACWPREIVLDRCTYNGFIGHNTPTNAASRIKWLSKMRPLNHGHDFWPQPYEQCAEVLRTAGDLKGSKEILVEKERLLNISQYKKLIREEFASGKKNVNIPLQILILLGMLSKNFLRSIISYGHRPLRAVIMLIFIIFIGGLFFKWSYNNDAMRPNQPNVLFSKIWIDCGINNRLGGSSFYFVSQIDCFNASAEGRYYPVFRPFVYSLNSILPIMSSEELINWKPNERTEIGKISLMYLWFHAIVGWFLMILAVAGFSGLVKTEAR